jgi:hypothetical protein
MLETLSFSETSVSTTATQRNIPEDGILHNKLVTPERIYVSCLQAILGHHQRRWIFWEVFMAVTVTNAFWGITPCGSRCNRRFGGTYCLYLQVGRTLSFPRSHPLITAPPHLYFFATIEPLLSIGRCFVNYFSISVPIEGLIKMNVVRWVELDAEGYESRIWSSN